MTNDELDQKWREAQARMKAMKEYRKAKEEAQGKEDKT